MTTETMKMTTDYNSLIRRLQAERVAILRRVWVAAVTLAALAVAVLPWPLWVLMGAWVALVAWATRTDETGYCE